MIRYGVYVALAACVLAVPRAMPQQPGRDPQRQAASAGDNSANLVTTPADGPTRALVLILSASGVPHHKGQIDWPPVLRLVRADAEMQRVEAQLHLAAEQVLAGGVNPKLLDELRLTVGDMERLLRKDRASRWPSLPADVYDNADHFLQQLRRTPRIADASPPARQ